MIIDYKTAVENIRHELKLYIQQWNLKSLVIGQSGGIDSALSTALAAPVCKELSIPLISRSITIVTNKPDERERAKKMGELFSSDFMEIDLSELFYTIKDEIEEKPFDKQTETHDYKIRIGNIKVRMRMVYLYNLAQRYKGLVISTDNYTELLLGFWTLHGDVGDYGMIQSLWKTEVFEMARYVALGLQDNMQTQALLSCVDAIPTDGLGITNSDLDQIKASTYAEVDNILIDYLRNGQNSKYVEHPVIHRHKNSEYKRNNPFNIPRNKITQEPLF